MEILFKGCFKAILEKYADPIINGVVKISKDEWEKFKIDFDIVFMEYLTNSYDKYSKIKTILYRTEPKYIYDFFEVPSLEKEQDSFIKAESINNILDISNFIIIQGTGGIGKSTLMKHLFLNELEKKDLIPVFLELKDVNNLEEGYSIYDIIFEKLHNLGSSLNKEYLEYALKSGCFLFLLDGYDEILSEKKDYFFKELDSFCDRYTKNYYIISSRPYSEFIEFQRFTILTTCPLSKGQAISLVKKTEFDEDVKIRFIKALDIELYARHRSFASNPLLLNIMLMTFDNYAEIPEKLHLFYSNAFETLYSKHDATKSGYRRELKSELSYDLFKKVFSYFCFVSYGQGKIEFSYDELSSMLKKSCISKVSFEINDYIDDLVNSLCVLYKEGLNYKFTHRSFQEYFTAVFLKELSDVSMQQMGTQLIHKDIFRAANDSVFFMLYDMTEERFEQNILLPILLEFEQECNTDDKYDFYFMSVVQEIRIDKNSQDANLFLWVTNGLNDITDFIYSCTRFYLIRNNKKTQEAANKLLNYICDNKRYNKKSGIKGKDIMNDSKMYELMKNTWIGEIIMVMSELSNKLSNKKRETELDLSSLLQI